MSSHLLVDEPTSNEAITLHASKSPNAHMLTENSDYRLGAQTKAAHPAEVAPAARAHDVVAAAVALDARAAPAAGLRVARQPGLVLAGRLRLHRAHERAPLADLRRRKGGGDPPARLGICVLLMRRESAPPVQCAAVLRVMCSHTGLGIA